VAFQRLALKIYISLWSGNHSTIFCETASAFISAMAENFLDRSWADQSSFESANLTLLTEHIAVLDTLGKTELLHQYLARRQYCVQVSIEMAYLLDHVSAANGTFSKRYFLRVEVKWNFQWNNLLWDLKSGVDW
jgi:hypothetical protein